MPRKSRSDVLPKVWLPKGLAEFEASLSDLKYTESLFSRLPKKHTKQYEFLLEQAMLAARAAEEAAQRARQQARFTALVAWGVCLQNCTIPQLQRATGYDQDE